VLGAPGLFVCGGWGPVSRKGAKTRKDSQRGLRRFEAVGIEDYTDFFEGVAHVEILREFGAELREIVFGKLNRFRAKALRLAKIRREDCKGSKLLEFEDYTNFFDRGEGVAHVEILREFGLSFARSHLVGLNRFRAKALRLAKIRKEDCEGLKLSALRIIPIFLRGLRTSRSCVNSG
jgi:hypothetical protein